MKNNKKQPTLEVALKLDMGCGRRVPEHPTRLQGFTGVDIAKIEGVDIVHDLTKTPYPFEDQSVEEIYTSHFIEHLTGEEQMRFFNECYRILKPGGRISCIAPYYSSMRCWQDPTHCFSDDTEILTDKGWEMIKDIKIGRQVYTLNPLTKKSELASVINTIYEDYSGEMYHFKTKRMDLLTTPNHDLYYDTIGSNKKYTAFRKGRADSFKNLKKHTRIGYCKLDCENLDNEIEYISIPFVKSEGGMSNYIERIPVDIFSQFLGWYLSEGYTSRTKSNNKGSYKVAICQDKLSNPDKYNMIDEMLSKTGYKYGKTDVEFYIYDKSLYNLLKPLGDSYSKYIPLEYKNLSVDNLKLILNSLILGDGRKNNKGFEYASTSKRLSDDVQEIAMKCGYRTSQYVEKREGLEKFVAGSAKASVMKDLYIVGISGYSNIYYPKPDIIDYNGKISCVTVNKNNLIMIRRNGKPIWSGNCTAISEARFYYYNKQWRETNGLDHYPITCDFDFTYGYVWNASMNGRSDTYKEFALRHYNNVVDDIHVYLTKR